MKKTVIINPTDISFEVMMKLFVIMLMIVINLQKAVTI